MSETSRKLNLDAALRAWPEVEKTAKEWDDRAQAIVERVRSGDRGATTGTLSDDDLLSAPLGQIREDGHNSAALAAEGPKMTMADRERDRRSLQDLAKMAATGLTPPPSQVPAPSSKPSGVQPAGHAKGEDSGLIDLRAVASEPAPSVAPPQSSNPMSRPAAPAPGLASQGLFDEDPVSQARPQQPAPSIPPMPASIPPQSYQAHAQAPSLHPSAPPPASIAPVVPLHASSSQSQPAHAQKKGNGAVIALVFGGIVALGAAAAGTFFYLKTHKPAEPVAATETKAPDVAPAPPPPATVAAKPADPGPAAEPSVDPNALPTSTPADQKVAAKTPAKTTAKAGAKAEATAEAPKPDAKLTQKDLPSEQQGPAGDLGKAMGAAVGDTGKKEQAKMDPAAGSNVPAGSVPQKPSQGAITGAIGAVLPAARVCLGPDDPVSHATVVFGSDGHVQSVSVTGAAQGKMAEGCIKEALMKAKVAPFAEPSYSTRITVRHQ